MTADGPDLEARVRAVEDRLAINELIARYAYAVDGRDDDGVAACFTDDAQASFAGVPTGRGGRAIAQFLAESMGGERRPLTTHRFTNVIVDLRGDEADVESSGVVYAVRGEPERLRVRGLTYRDRVIRTEDGWRIRRRIHNVSWEAAADAVPLTPIQKQTASDDDEP
jgi:hypothetical protein